MRTASNKIESDKLAVDVLKDASRCYCYTIYPSLNFDKAYEEFIKHSDSNDAKLMQDILTLALIFIGSLDIPLDELGKIKQLYASTKQFEIPPEDEDDGLPSSGNHPFWE